MYVCVRDPVSLKTLSKALDGITPLIVATLNGSLEVGLGEYTIVSPCTWYILNWIFAAQRIGCG